MFQNIVIGKPLVEPWKLISTTEEEFERFDKHETLFTEERFLPAVLVEAGVVSSRSEVRRNKPELCITLDKLDCLWIKWGKNKIWIIVGCNGNNTCNGCNHLNPGTGDCDFNT